MNNEIIGWFTTEDGIHVPIKKGQSKKEAIDSHFNNKVMNSTNNKKYEQSKNIIEKMINAGEARGLDDITRKNNPEKYNEMVNWVNSASGTHDIEMTKSIIRKFMR